MARSVATIALNDNILTHTDDTSALRLANPILQEGT